MSERTVSRRQGGIQIRWTPKLVFSLVLLLLAVIFALQNFEHVDVQVFFWEVRMRLVWTFLIFALIGAFLGWMLPRLRHGLRRR